MEAPVEKGEVAVVEVSHGDNINKLGGLNAIF